MNDHVPGRLTQSEKFWRDRYEFFKVKGYFLRPRYHPDWQPSWHRKDVLLSRCEDFVMQLKGNILDASTLDGTVVFIKKIDRERYPSEKDIALYFSKNYPDHPHNHCVRILDDFPDERDDQVHYIVMPLLREFNDPVFESIKNVIEFVDQTLEGLAFMHDKGIAHRDCANQNIMMDGEKLVREPWHPVVPIYTLDYRDTVTFRNRTDAPVRYYFIDFGFSSRFQPGQARLVVGSKCRDPDPPELYDNKPYDPFKLDIFCLGNVFKKDIFNVFRNVDFLQPLIDKMTAKDPTDRPTAHEAIAIWQPIRHANLHFLQRRLPGREETMGQRMLYDVLSSTSNAIHGMRDAMGSWTN